MRKFFLALLSIALTASAHAQTAVIGAANRTPIDCSGTIASGGTAQSLLDAAKNDLHGFCIQNLDNSEFLYMNFNSAASTSAQGSYGLQPSSSTVQGGSFCSPTGMGVKLNPSIIATTTGHKYTCTWW